MLRPKSAAFALSYVFAMLDVDLGARMLFEERKRAAQLQPITLQADVGANVTC